MTEVPEEYRDLVAGGVYGTIGTLDANGSPHMTPIWVDYDDAAEQFLVNTVKGRRKERNLRRNSSVALSLMHPENPRRYLSMQGEAVAFETKGAVKQFEAMALNILGEENFFSRRYDDADAVTRILVRIRPDVIYTR